MFARLLMANGPSFGGRIGRRGPDVAEWHESFSRVLEILRSGGCVAGISPLSDRSKVKKQTRRRTLVLQVGI